MNKPKFYISCPIDTFSGYGSRSRDLVKAIIKSDKYQVKIFPQRWGDTPWGFIENNIEEWGFLLDYIIKHEDPKLQPDIWAQITIPSEFSAVGKYNVGITAGMETTLVDASWIQGMNRMNVNFVSSEHSKNTFLNSKYDQFDQNRNKVGELKIEKPIEILFEGVILEKYKPIDSTFNLENIPENFCFLCVGHWIGNAIIGEDRKNISLTIKTFLETFKNKTNPPALILKTSGAGSSYMDREQILKKYYSIKSQIKGNLPNVYLIHGELSDEDMNNLYNHPKIKAMISLTKGEGFGRPLIEFSAIKKPIIASGWSGQIDFLKPEFTVLLKGELKNVHPSAVVKNMILKESSWFNPNINEASSYMKDIYKNYKKYHKLAKRQAYYTKTNFSWEKMYERLIEYLDKYIPTFPEQIELKIPKIKLPEKCMKS